MSINLREYVDIGKCLFKYKRKQNKFDKICVKRLKPDDADFFCRIIYKIIKKWNIRAPPFNVYLSKKANK